MGHLPQSESIVFVEPGEGCTIAYASIKVPITVYSPQNFDSYRKDARKLLKVIQGECTAEDVQTIPEFSYNAMGCNTFLAALAYEILDQESHLRG